MNKDNFMAMQSVYIIAEIGVNHNGDMRLAKSLILAAKMAGADAVKFQSYKTELLAKKDTPKVTYQKINAKIDESHFDMLKKFELTCENHEYLISYCNQCEIDFISTPYDVESADLLHKLGIKIFKTASADLIDLRLHKFLAKTGKAVIIATGMSNLKEINQAVDIYRGAKNDKITLLHCVSNYPCSDHSVNMRAMNTLRDAFSYPVGYSDHSLGSIAAILSVSMGASVIEKHITLDKGLPGPDHGASSDIIEFTDYVSAIRRAELMLGSPQKKCQPEEEEMAKVSRKSIAFVNSKKNGEILSESDFFFIRPGTGMPANTLDQVLGRRLLKDKKPYDFLKWDDFE
jgi:sialic acid synthase SpsE